MLSIGNRILDSSPYSTSTAPNSTQATSTNTKEDERTQLTKVHNQNKTINKAKTKYGIIAHISIISVISYAVTPVREIA